MSAAPGERSPASLSAISAPGGAAARSRVRLRFFKDLTSVYRISTVRFFNLYLSLGYFILSSFSELTLYFFSDFLSGILGS